MEKQIRIFKKDALRYLKSPAFIMLMLMVFFSVTAMGQDISLDQLADATENQASAIFRIIGIIIGLGLVAFIVGVIIAFARKKDDAGTYLIYWIVAVVIYIVIFRNFLMNMF